jgi:hypothetical protein
METFGRGCLYLILGVIGLTVFVMITRSSIHIPWIILIPVILIVFWIASQKSKK